MDRYFYIVEMLDNKKVVHLQGNIFNISSDSSEKDYRLAEWCGLFFDIDELQLMIDTDTLFEYLHNHISYLKDLTKKEASQVSNNYFGNLGSSNLSIYEISNETAIGNYWYDKEK